MKRFGVPRKHVRRHEMSETDGCYDRTQWPRSLALHLSNNFSRIDCSQEAMKGKKCELRSEAKSRAVDGLHLPNIDLGDVVKVRTNPRTGTSSGSLIVPELIECLTLPIWFWIVELARARVDSIVL